MIKNFDKVKGQLNDLAEILNKFNSETVQLKLIDLLFTSIEKEKTEERPAVKKAEGDEKPKRRGRPRKVVAEQVPVEAPVAEEPKVEKAAKEPKVEKAAKEPKVEKAAKEPKAPKEKKEKKAKKEKKEAGKPRQRKAKESVKRTSERPGPSSMLRQLVQDEYFSEKRTIGNIVNYCNDAFQFEYKSTDLSGTLAKMTKEGVLIREKNPESNQFEYIKA